MTNRVQPVQVNATIVPPSEMTATMPLSMDPDELASRIVALTIGDDRDKDHDSNYSNTVSLKSHTDGANATSVPQALSLVQSSIQSLVNGIINFIGAYNSVFNPHAHPSSATDSAEHGIIMLLVLLCKQKTCTCIIFMCWYLGCPAQCPHRAAPLYRYDRNVESYNVSIVSQACFPQKK